MVPDPRAWLWDVQDAGAAIASFTVGIDEAGYANSPLIFSAVERKFEIIGEALNQLSKAAPEIAASIPHLAQIVAFRNQLAHGYAQIDHATVWGAIHNSLPALMVVVAAQLKALEGRG